MKFLNPLSLRSDKSKFSDDFSLFWIGKSTGAQSRKLFDRFKNWQTNYMEMVPIIFDGYKMEEKMLLVWFEPSVKISLAHLWPVVVSALFENQKMTEQISAIDIYSTFLFPLDLNFQDFQGQSRTAKDVCPIFDFKNLTKIGKSF